MEDTMVWTEITLRHYRREGLRYASDLTDAERALIEPTFRLRRRLAGRVRPIRAGYAA